MGMDEVQPVLGASHPDVRQAALLLELTVVLERTPVRQQALLEPDHEDDGELEALRRVQRDQCDPVRAVLERVLVGDQCHLLQEASETLRWRDLVELGGVVAQLGDIGPAIGAFIGTVVDRVLEAAALERRVEDRARRLAARHLHQRAHERSSAWDWASGPQRHALF